MRIAIVSDAWSPQINGVVTTLTRVGECLVAMGHEACFITPEQFRTMPCPGYAEIRLALAPGRAVRQRLDDLRPEAIHIATEGPLGWAARAYCRVRNLPFTTAYHTQFPQYLRMRAPVPLWLTYACLRRFHGAAARTLVATASLRDELRARGFVNLAMWSRGVDSTLFRPRDKAFLDAPRPVTMYVGRVSVEKNIQAFLRLDLPGTRYVVGDGPDLKRLRALYPDVRFVGYRTGEDLARHVAAADCFVFPSRTDTFGLTMLEAMACGVPVAAYPVTGPRDVIRDGVTGALDEDLARACRRALALRPEACVAFARRHDWDACTRRFLSHLEPVGGTLPQGARRNRTE